MIQLYHKTQNRITKSHEKLEVANVLFRNGFNLSIFSDTHGHISPLLWYLIHSFLLFWLALCASWAEEIIFHFFLE